ncbi:MAG: TlpA disulfide reductase family protein [Chitinophagaceae bacterium]
MLQKQKLSTLLILSFLIFHICANAQDATEKDPAPTLHIGDDAPPLYVGQWLKGTPFKNFKKGKSYVIEYWATWCGPCKAAMPHLSKLAATYKGKIDFLGVDVMEDKKTPIQKIKHFVDSMGQRMDYAVATDNNDLMIKEWLKAAGEDRKGIPHTFVVNAAGKIAWMGHPKDLPPVLEKIAGNNWDVKEALANYNEEQRLTKIDEEAMYHLINYVKSPNWASSVDKPDSLLLEVEAIVGKEPKLKYATHIAIHTFNALLKTDMHKAYLYGKEAQKTSFFGDPISYYIMGNIENSADSLPLTPEIFQLGIEACQLEINQTVYPEIASTYRIYNRMANWYWRINDHSKAIETQEKAIADIKSKTSYAAKDLASMEAQLEKYRQY